MNQKQQLAIFDLDGTLFDTKEVNYLAYRSALSEFGFILDKDRFLTASCGKHYTEFLPILTEGPSESLIIRVHSRKKNFMLNFS